jgi:hypothetical protein
MRAPRLAASFTAVTLAIACPGFAADGDPAKDKVLLREGRPMEVLIESEAGDKLTYRTIAGGQVVEKRARDVLSIVYGGMSEGEWKAGAEARAAGRYEEAADRFSGVAGGEREWQKVYGAMAAGECLELAGKPAAAAEEYAKVVAGFPRHRLWLDACYRQGMALALAKKDAEAGKIADDLIAYGKKANSSPAEARAAAVRAAMAFAKGGVKDGKFREHLRKAILRSSDEPDTWFHFNLWQAGVYREGGETRDALRTVDGMLQYLDGDPVRRAQVLFIKGMSQIDSDPQGAIVELLKLDCIPYGTAAQLIEARATAGRLLVEQARALRGENDARKKEIAGELEATARVVLSAAANAPGDHPAKAKAKELLDAVTPKPPPPPPAAVPATAAAAKPAATAAAAKPATPAAAK